MISKTSVIGEAIERSNEQWVSDLRADGARFDEAYRALAKLIRRGLAKTLQKRGPIDDALLDDLTQIAVVRILDKLDSFRGASRFSTWAYSVAFRAAFSELRKCDWRHRSLTDFELDGEPDAAYRDDAEDAETALQRRRVLEALEHSIRQDLSKRQRQGILAELDGMPIAAIEAKMGSQRNAVYKLLHDARLKLKRSLTEAGISDADIRAAFARRN